MSSAAVTLPRADELFREHFDANARVTSRVFAWLFIGQWAFAMMLALVWSPYGWAGKAQVIHAHVWAALGLGGLLCSLPLFLALKRPAAVETRMVVAVSQMLWSALLIHLSGGRIETHFHVFGSLAFVAFYRDWRVLVPATVVVAGDHLLRGIFWPESVYGIANPEWWRFVEHALWVVFEDVVLVLACVRGVAELRSLAERQAQTEALNHSERVKSEALERALGEIKASHEALSRAEKLAAVGQLAASVGHELRNPLGAVRNGLAYVTRRLNGPPHELAGDKRVPEFLGVMDRELNQCVRIISSLLDFARERKLDMRPCPLRPLVDDAVGLVPARPNVRVDNQVGDELPIPLLDKEQFRQVLANLVQNAVESIPADKAGTVTVSAQAAGDGTVFVAIADNGSGIAAQDLERIFQPLFTTKTKGTGLGLAIVEGLVKKHGGTISVRSAPGHGTVFTVQLPPPAVQKAA